MLVYEMCENGSLDDRLFPGRCYSVAGQLSGGASVTRAMSNERKGRIQWREEVLVNKPCENGGSDRLFPLGKLPR